MLPDTEGPGYTEDKGLASEDLKSDREIAAEKDQKKTPGTKPENLPDRRDEVPDLILFEGERVINVEIPEISIPTQDPVAIKALMTLTDAEYEEEIGKHGPSVASRIAPPTRRT